MCYQPIQFARVLIHSWDKHQLDRNFKYICGISSCASSYTNLQSLHRHAKTRHFWFFDKHMKFFKNKFVPSCDGEEFSYGDAEEGQPYDNEPAGNKDSEMEEEDDDDDGDFEL